MGKKSMASQEHLDKMQLRQNYWNLWHTDLMNTIQADTPLDHVLRTGFANEHFIMICQGVYAVLAICLVVAGVAKVSAPEFCLATEVFLCFGNSVASTRFLLQDEFNIQTTQCDNCIIAFMFFLLHIARLFAIVAMIVRRQEIREASKLLSCLADMVYCSHNTKLRWTNVMASLVHSQ